MSRTILLRALQLSLVLFPWTLQAQDAHSLRINELLASNKSVGPTDSDGDFEDMLEIYNPTDVSIRLKDLQLANDVTVDAQGKYHPVAPWTFPAASIMAKGFVLVFCDNQSSQAEHHAGFKLSSDGEVVALFTQDGDLIDMVVFPHMPENVAYGRVPDGSGSFCFLQTPTFRRGSYLAGGSTDAQNSGCGPNLSPEIDLHAYQSITAASDVNPGAGKPVPLVAESWDDKEDGIDKVLAVFRVESGAPVEVPMAFQSYGLQRDYSSADPTATIEDKRRAIWGGEIPGQPSGSLVTFILHVEDKDGAAGQQPKNLCGTPPASGCKVPFRYLVDYHYDGPLVLNEVVPSNLNIILDTTDGARDDYIEICSSVAMNLDGLRLSSSAFHPEGWAFPVGSRIDAGEHLLVWIDSDEKHTRADLKDFHTDFNLSADGESIFIFDTEANRFGYIDGLRFGKTEADIAYSRLPDCDRTAPFTPVKNGSPREANHPEQPPDKKFIRGDADMSGGLDITDPVNILSYLFQGAAAPTCLDASDADDNGLIDISDPISLLNFLFQGGGAPPAPFPQAGTDPNPDILPPCS